MRIPRRPVFLGRIPYRRRRLRDAARLLPLFGLFLLVLPLLWSPPGSALRLLSGDLVYLFAVWLGLIGVAAGFAPGLSRHADDGDDSVDGDED
ncbi:hypothetical protein LHP98_05335 [Rhodobacter sp. Har01]|uniref:hypothetical protein n=1 Tax=Rhodobacter sp. Har01 TaxID=2883999 RepID=UPI001D05CADC|nr:hypothetical protein [Rhodobacter sp. Har01]MCB6177552.1 hypothetical protein [Rhodobacter sp. Har01]